jgi:integrase
MPTYDVALGRILPRLGTTAVEKLDAPAVADMVVELHAAGLKKQTIRKTVSVLAMVLDHARIEPDPARDRLTAKTPREEKREVQPPTADHVEAVLRLLPSKYRLPVVVLEATGMRIGELEALTWGDIDEPRGRWRIATSKTGRPRWVTPSSVLYAAVLELFPRDDRHADRKVVRGHQRRPDADCDHAGLHGVSRAGVLAARPPTPARLAHAPTGRPVGQDRRGRGARRHHHYEPCLHPRRHG